jgi:hypothetical protein
MRTVLSILLDVEVYLMLEWHKSNGL